MGDHYLKHPSSFIVVVLRSLRHGACVNCGLPLHTEKEAVAHWLAELTKPDTRQLPLFPEETEETEKQKGEDNARNREDSQAPDKY